MKQFYIDYHTNECLALKDKVSGYLSYDFHRYCEMNPEKFLFFLGNEFYLITYHNCFKLANDYDFKIDLIKRICNDFQIFEYYEIDKSYVDEDLKEFRRKNKDLKKYIQQVNYVYSNAAGKEYCITTKANYIDAICNMDTVKNNYNIAKETLINSGNDYLLDSLNNLYHKNYIGKLDDIEIVRTVEHLIKSINKLTN